MEGIFYFHNSQYPLLQKFLNIIVSSTISEFIFLKIGPFQHGFIKGRFVLTNLLLYNDFLSTAFKNGVKVDSIYIEFSKAFDTVNYRLLLQKVWNVGIRGKLFSWLQSYLTDRTQRVRTCGTKSYRFVSTSGFPLGSNIGPILFILFINSPRLFTE